MTFNLKLSLRPSVVLSLASALMAACGNTPPAPDWQSNSLGAVKSFTRAYLAGDSKVADFEFARSRNEISATGRPDLVARAELVRCAVRLASLELDACAATQLKTPDLAAPERAYALGAAGYLTKPLSVNELALQVRRILDLDPAAATREG